MLLDVLATAVQRTHVRQPKGLGDRCGDLDLLAYAIHEEELTLGEEDRQRDPREAAPCAEVEDTRAGLEADHLCDAQRVQDVMLVEGVDVLAGDDVDLGVPVAVEGIQSSELALLLLSELGEILQDKLHRMVGGLSS